MQRSAVIANLLKKSKTGFTRCINQITIDSYKVGSIWLKLQVGPEHVNRYGNLHDSLPGVLIDFSSMITFYTFPDESRLCLSVNMDIKYLERAKTGDEILINTNLLHRTNNTAVFESKILNSLNKNLLIQGSHTMSLMESDATYQILYTPM